MFFLFNTREVKYLTVNVPIFALSYHSFIYVYLNIQTPPPYYQYFCLFNSLIHCHVSNHYKISYVIVVIVTKIVKESLQIMTVVGYIYLTVFATRN